MDKDKDKDKYKENKPEKTTAKVINNKVKPPMVKDTPTGSKMLSSVPIVNETTVANGNIYQTSGKGDDGQFEFSKMVTLMGKSQVGYLDCWTDPKNWVLTTEYKQDTGLQAPLHQSKVIEVSWDLFSGRTDDVVFTSHAPTLNVDGYGAKPVYRSNTKGFGSANAQLPNANFIPYLRRIQFIYDKKHDAWIIEKFMTSDVFIYVPHRLSNYGGYIEIRNATPIDPDTQPMAYEIFHDTKFPDMNNTALVGYYGGISDFKVIKKGQVGTAEDLGSFQIMNAIASQGSLSAQGTILNINEGVNYGTGIFGSITYDTEPAPVDSIGQAFYLNATKYSNATDPSSIVQKVKVGGVPYGTETLTKRLGLYCLWVV